MRIAKFNKIYESSFPAIILAPRWLPN